MADKGKGKGKDKGGDDGGKKEKGDKGSKKEDAKKEDAKKEESKKGDKKDAAPKAAAPKAEAKKEAPKKDAAPKAAAPKKADGAEGETGHDEEVGADGEKKRRAPFRRFFYRGIEVHKLLDLSHAELMKLFHARARRRFARGHVPMHLIKRIRKAKKQSAAQEGKPVVVKTHLRNMIVMPEMVGSVLGVYNGMGFTQVEIKPDMIGHYLGEFSITYKPVKHGRPGVGATGSSRFVPLK